MAPPEPFYRDELVDLHWGSAEQIVPLLPRADLVIIDPPYGIQIGKDKHVGGHGHNRVGKYLVPSTSFGTSNWDSSLLPAWLLQMLIAHGKHAIVFGGNFYSNALAPSPCWLTWDKKINGDFADVELMWTNFSRSARLAKGSVTRLPDHGNVAMYEYMWNGMLQGNLGGNNPSKEERLHPTQKPVQLLQWCLQLFPPLPKLVIDPMAGSGVTGRACKNLGIKCILIEREKQYVDIIVKQMRQWSLPLAPPPKAPQPTLRDVPLFDDNDIPIAIPANQELVPES